MPCAQPVKAGRCGEVAFAAGFYIYVGSARRGFKSRLRHYLRPINKPRWHIDYLLAHADLKGAVLAATEEALECGLAAALGERLEVVPRFGSSDCRCPGHLFLATDEEAARVAVSQSLQSIKIEPCTMGRRELEEFLGL